MSDNTIQIPENLTKEEAEKALRYQSAKKYSRKEKWDSEYLHGNGIPKEFYEEMHTSIQKWIAPKNYRDAEDLLEIIHNILFFKGWHSF